MRQESGSVPDLISTLITSLFITNTSETTLQKLWTDRTTAVYGNLSFTDLAYYLDQSPDGQEILASSAPADFIACNLPNLDNEVAKWTNFTCIDCYCPTPGDCLSSITINPDEEGTIPTLPTRVDFYQETPRTGQVTSSHMYQKRIRFKLGCDLSRVGRILGI